MFIVDVAKPRRKEKLEKALGGEYLPVHQDDPWPRSDYLLVPAAWWYKEKWKPYADKANLHPGKTVLMDYAREMAQPRKNKSGIKAPYVALLGDRTPNHIKALKWSMPEFDPSPQFERRPEKNTVLVTMEDSKDVKGLIAKLKGKHIIWKMRSKYRHLKPYYEKCLRKSDYEMIAPKEKDYNWARPLVELCAERAESHVHVAIRSVVNQEMVRFGVPTTVWINGKFVEHPIIKETRKWYEGKPEDWCVQNLIRNLRENLSSH